MKKSLFILVFALTAIGSLFAAEVSLEAYQKTYSAELKKIEEERTAGLAKLMDSYSAAVDKLVETSQAKGQLDDLLAAKKEQERLGKEKSVPAEAPAKLSEAVKALRLNYFDVGGKIEAEWNIKKINLTRKYTAALDGLTRKLTKGGKLEEALAARNEKQKAETILAECKSSLPDQNGRGAVAPKKTADIAGIPPTLKADLILYHDFNAIDRDKVRDKSASGHHGVVYGAKWVADGRGPANGVMQFDDEKSYVDLGDIFNDLDYPVTLSLWLKVHEFPRDWVHPSMAFETDTRRNAGKYYGFWVSMGKHHKAVITLGDGVGNWGGSRATFSGPLVEKDTWIHLSVVMSKEGICSIYRNAEKMPTTAVSAGDGSAKIKAITHCSEPAVIGWGFQGLLDDVMLWKRALTDQEIKQAYTLTGGR